MRLLPVTPSDVVQRGETDVRLAHRVAAFFGVPTTTAPAGVVWVAQYDALTLAELARGGLLPARKWQQKQKAQEKAKGAGQAPAVGTSNKLPANTWWIVDHALLRGVGGDDVPAGLEGAVQVDGIFEIAPSTLKRFGPDRKASAVLTGADLLFDTIRPAMSEVLSLLAPRLGRRMRLALWATLVQEAYRSQPALFAAAVQARSVQRALTLPWAPIVTPETPVARAEFGSEDLGDARKTSRTAPRLLGILDGTLAELQEIGGPSDAVERSRRYLRDDVISRCTKHLLESADSGFVWVTEPAPGVRQANVHMSTLDAIVSLVDDVMIGLEPDGPILPEHWDRYVPVVPDARTLASMSEKGRQLTVWALVQLVRIVRGDTRSDGIWGIRTTEILESVADLSVNVLGPYAPVTAWAQNRWANAVLSDARQRGAQHTADEVHEATIAMRRTTTFLRELHRSGHLDGGFFAECMHASTKEMRLALERLRREDDQSQADEIDIELAGVWQDFFEVLGIDPDRDLFNGQYDPEARPLVAAVATHTHNYVAYLTTSSVEGAQERAVALAESLSVPSRRHLAHARQSDRPLQLALQVAITAIGKLIRQRGAEIGERRSTLARTARDHAYELSRMPFIVGALKSVRSLTRSEELALCAVAEGWLLALEAGDDGVSPDQVRTVVTRMVAANPAEISAEDGADEVPQPARVRSLLRRLEELDGLREAEAAVVASAEKILASVVAAGPALVDLGDPTEAGQEFAGVRSGSAGGGDGHKIELDDEAFLALRGLARPRFEGVPVLRMMWSPEAGGTLTFRIHQPIVRPEVTAVAVRFETDAAERTVQLRWEATPGQAVEMIGVAEGVPEPDWDAFRAVVDVHGVDD